MKAAIKQAYSMQRFAQVGFFFAFSALVWAMPAQAQTAPAPSADDISEIQFWLKRQGVFNGPIDGSTSSALLNAVASVLRVQDVGSKDWPKMMEQTLAYKAAVGVDDFIRDGEEERRKVESDFSNSFLGKEALVGSMLRISGFETLIGANSEVRKNLLQIFIQGTVALPLRLNYREQILAFYNPVFDQAIVTEWSGDRTRSIVSAGLYAGELLRDEVVVSVAPHWETSGAGYIAGIEKNAFATLIAIKKLTALPKLIEGLNAKGGNGDAKKLAQARFFRMFVPLDNQKFRCGAQIDLFASQFPKSLASAKSKSLASANTSDLERHLPLVPVGGISSPSAEQDLVRYFVPQKSAHIVFAIRGQPKGQGCDLEVEAINLDAPTPDALKLLQSASGTPPTGGVSQSGSGATGENATGASIVTGEANVVSTSVIVIGGQKITLQGVNGLEGTFADGFRAFLREQGGKVTCQRTAETGYKCKTASDVDLALAVIFNGSGRALDNAPDNLKRAEQSARERKLGIWASSQK